MEKTLTGQIVKIIANRYTVKCGERAFVAYAGGKLRLVGDLYVGDKVVFRPLKPYAVIEEVLKRKNSLIRPYVANIDAVLIMIAKEPEPDLLLADKIIINCYKEGIEPVLCYNKSDLAEDGEIEKIFSAYRDMLNCVAVSAKDGTGFDKLKEVISGRLIALAGQSAVGKTSILNALSGLRLKTGELSEKIARGKNTTRHIEIFEALGGSVIDTCGFSMLELLDIKPEELKLYYDEYIELSANCRYHACCHIWEPGCAVKKALGDGVIDSGRYGRYNIIYKELKEQEKSRYE